MANKPELKIKEFDKYHSYYCGLCRTLNDNFGFFGRVTLNYDLVFLVMLLADLYDNEDETVVTKRCIAHPLKKHEERVSEVSDYCSKMCILLTYYKFLDDWNDEHKIKSKVAMSLLKKKIKKIEEAYPNKASIIIDNLSNLSKLEKNNSDSIDDVTKCFGNIMGEVFTYKIDEYKDDLFRVGFFLGKFIYLLDAYEDLEDDIENKSYNPLIELSKDKDFENKILNILLMMISECTDAFERLPLINNTEILRNILYSGIWGRYTLKKEKKEKVVDGSI